MSFQIVRTAPVYCQITDGLIGGKLVSRSHAYETLALARYFAGRQAQANYDACGDDSFVVVPFGGCPWSNHVPRGYTPTPSDLDDEIPF